MFHAFGDGSEINAAEDQKQQAGPGNGQRESVDAKPGADRDETPGRLWVRCSEPARGPPRTQVIFFPRELSPDTSIGSGPETTLETARKKWGEARADLFEKAEINGGHAHRFRDTFAVELLKSGTPIERASTLGSLSVTGTCGSARGASNLTLLMLWL